MHWILAQFFILMSKFKFTSRFKIQSDTKNRLTPEEWKDLKYTVYTNQFVFLPLTVLVVYILFMDENSPMLDFKSIQPFPVVVFKVFIGMSSYELFFYYFHRILHHKSIYKYIHKKHHKFTAPFAMVGQYQHPVEYILCDVISPGIGIFVARCETSTATVYITLVVLVALADHCGYHYPFFISPEPHDYHHANYNECFSTNGFLDFIHGTSKGFRMSDRFKKHKTYWGFRWGGKNKN